MIKIKEKNFLPEQFKNYIFFLVFLAFFIGIIIFIFLKFLFGLFILFLIFIFLALPAIIYFLLYFKNFSFVIDEEKIIVYSGVLTKKSKLIIFKNIQSIEIISGIIERFFNIARVEIFTSSPQQIVLKNIKTIYKPDIVFYLLIPDAQSLRDFIFKKEISE